VNTIPSHDVVLRRVVDRITAEDAPGTAAELAARLRPLFPRVAVFERQLSGEWPHLYVYRDGRYEPERPDAWWSEPGVPCARISARSGILTSVTGAWAQLMRAQESDLVGRHFLDFVVPEARAAAQAMFEAVMQEREVRSEALVVRPDGTTLLIEFRAAQRDGEIDVCYRPRDP
jgi:PAS domain-containing protein